MGTFGICAGRVDGAQGPESLAVFRIHRPGQCRCAPLQAIHHETGVGIEGQRPVIGPTGLVEVHHGVVLAALVGQELDDVDLAPTAVGPLVAGCVGGEGLAGLPLVAEHPHQRPQADAARHFDARLDGSVLERRGLLLDVPGGVVHQLRRLDRVAAGAVLDASETPDRMPFCTEIFCGTTQSSSPLTWSLRRFSTDHLAVSTEEPEKSSKKMTAAEGVAAACGELPLSPAAFTAVTT